MAKKDISKILTTGSLKQRLLLIFEERTRDKVIKKKLLTDKEYSQLIDSIKTPAEVKKYNEFLEYEESLITALVNLHGLSFEVKTNASNLRGYLLLWNSLENTEMLVNSVLHEIKNRNERKRIAKSGAVGIDLLFSKIKIDKEGYIEIDIDHEEKSEDVFKKNSFLKLINKVKTSTENSIIKYLSWEKAVFDYMEDTGFNIKTYKEYIVRITQEVKAPAIWLAKYRGQYNGGAPYPGLSDLLDKYNLCPNPEERSISKEHYNYFRKNFLDGKEYPDHLRGVANKSYSDE